MLEVITEYLSGANCVVLEIPLKPISTPRPRFAKRGKFVTTYNTSEYTEQKNALTEHLKKSGLVKRNYFSIGFIMEFAYPKSTAKKNLIHNALKTTKPDWDNLPKAFQDCLTEDYLEGDDSTISIGMLVKRYSLQGDKMICYLWYR